MSPIPDGWLWDEQQRMAEFRTQMRMEFYASLATQPRYHYETAPDPFYSKPPQEFREALRWIKRVVLHQFRPERVKVYDRSPAFVTLTGLVD